MLADVGGDVVLFQLGEGLAVFRRVLRGAILRQFVKDLLSEWLGPA